MRKFTLTASTLSLSPPHPIDLPLNYIRLKRFLHIFFVSLISSFIAALVGTRSCRVE